MGELGVLKYTLQVVIYDELVIKYTTYLFAFSLICYILLVKVLKYKHNEGITISYDITAPIALTFMSYNGICLWFGLNGYPPLVPGDPYKENEDIKNLIVLPMMCYQFWNLIFTFLIEEYYTAFAVVHHITTIAVAIYALYPSWLYYLTYFFGFTELSTTFYCISILVKRFPKFHKKFSFVAPIFDALFVLSFFSFRIFYYFYIIVDYWKESWEEMMKYDSKFGMHSFVFICTLVITFLQLYFSKQIIDEARKLLQKPDAEKKEK
jgi:hypothetical protein